MRGGGRQDNSNTALSAIQIAHALLRQSRELFVSIPQPAESSLPDVSSMTAFAHNLAIYVQREILEKKDLADRAKMYKRWVIILDECYKKGDLQCAQAIYGGLTATPIYRLKITRIVAQEEMLPRLKERFEFISRMLINSKHHAMNEKNKITIVPDIRAFLAADAQAKVMVETFKEHRASAVQSWHDRIGSAEVRLRGLPEYFRSQQDKAKKNSISSSQTANEYVSSQLQPNNVVGEKTLLEASTKLEPTIKPQQQRHHHQEINKADIVKFFFAQTATGGLTPLINNILNDKSALAKVRLDTLSKPSFMTNLNELLVEKSPDKSKLVRLLADAGITLDHRLTNTNYNRVCEQARYHAQLTSESLRELLGNQYLKGKAGFFERSNTGSKVRILNDFFNQSPARSWENAKPILQKLLGDVGISISRGRQVDGVVALAKLEAVWKKHCGVEAAASLSLRTVGG